jgi:hypothetical protein
MSFAGALPWAVFLRFGLGARFVVLVVERFIRRMILALSLRVAPGSRSALARPASPSREQRRRRAQRDRCWSMHRERRFGAEHPCAGLRGLRFRRSCSVRQRRVRFAPTASPKSLRSTAVRCPDPQPPAVLVRMQRARPQTQVQPVQYHVFRYDPSPSPCRGVLSSNARAMHVLDSWPRRRRHRRCLCRRRPDWGRTPRSRV